MAVREPLRCARCSWPPEGSPPAALAAAACCSSSLCLRCARCSLLTACRGSSGEGGQPSVTTHERCRSWCSSSAAQCSLQLAKSGRRAVRLSVCLAGRPAGRQTGRQAAHLCHAVLGLHHLFLQLPDQGAAVVTASRARRPTSSSCTRASPSPSSSASTGSAATGLLGAVVESII